MTSCAPTDRLLQTLRVHTPGATDELLSLELFNVMDEFFRRTSAWIHHDEVPLSEGLVEYTYSVPSGATMVRMFAVTHNNLPVPMASAGGSVQTGYGVVDPALVFPDGDAAFEPDANDLIAGMFSWAVFRPEFVTINVPSTEILQYPARLTMALSLDKGCLECESNEWNVPEWHWNMFFEDWLDGTLSRLYGMPAKPWSSPTHAVYHGRRFRNHMAFRKQEAPRGFVYNAQGPWRFPGSWVR